MTPTDWKDRFREDFKWFCREDSPRYKTIDCPSLAVELENFIDAEIKKAREEGREEERREIVEMIEGMENVYMSGPEDLDYMVALADLKDKIEKRSKVEDASHEIGKRFGRGIDKLGEVENKPSKD